MKLKDNALSLANNYDLEKSTLEFIKDNIWVELDFKWFNWESAHLANPNNQSIVHLIPYGLLVWYEEESEETEEDIIWTYKEYYNEIEKETFYEKYKSHLILFWVIVIFVLLWLNYNYQVKQQEIEKAKTELRLKDKYEVLTDLDNQIDLKIDEELRKQEQIKLDLANSYEKVKNLKAQKDQNFNNKLKLTN